MQSGCSLVASLVDGLDHADAASGVVLTHGVAILLRVIAPLISSTSSIGVLYCLLVYVVKMATDSTQLLPNC